MISKKWRDRELDTHLDPTRLEGLVYTVARWGYLIYVKEKKGAYLKQFPKRKNALEVLSLSINCLTLDSFPIKWSNGGRCFTYISPYIEFKNNIPSTFFYKYHIYSLNDNSNLHASNINSKVKDSPDEETSLAYKDLLFYRLILSIRKQTHYFIRYYYQSKYFIFFFESQNIIYIYIYNGIKSQVLHRKEKIKTPKTPKMSNPLTTAPQRTNIANTDQLGTI